STRRASSRASSTRSPRRTPSRGPKQSCASCSGSMPGGDEIRAGQRAAWAALSPGWEKWDAVIVDQLGPVGTAMIESLEIRDDQQHLDIAAGTGEPGLTIAKLA